MLPLYPQPHKEMSLLVTFHKTAQQSLLNITLGMDKACL